MSTFNINLGPEFGSNNTSSISPFANTSYEQPQFGGAGSSSSTDSIMQMEQQMLQLMQELMQMIEQLEGGQSGQGGQGTQGAGSGSGGSGQPSFPGGGYGLGDMPQVGAANSQHFNSASFSSWGDPHQSFTGDAGANGGSMNGHADYMGSQSDLIDANRSILGGYQVSTDTTAPDSNGITYNKDATVKMNDGRTTVTMGQDGSTTVNDNGMQTTLQKGQSITLSNGATVAEGQDGKVTVSDNNDEGGSISTTLSWNGQGVDVHGTAQNIDLGGYDVGLGQQADPSYNQLV